mmetsp:Transcript_25984/g.61952  ORF Transcript_25984/g.61952 Transcript_25984/m.61952 type:complete len:298 (-) Transcript_25984:20-913(-)|eukprot:CAMPEP_0181400380 /NCGR_PEP_ID=MMETSP1110-20121109/2086_1 /TAXON_ID=174948 /ORGANISM="Symbiodinium sp., Strain CCMP421" /LENGTH=297 /DNA_ID=CAMNT_0023522479 /DNA_START=46 /DNA_END=939 /DNA_ORIENTATION=-
MTRTANSWCVLAPLCQVLHVLYLTRGKGGTHVTAAVLQCKEFPFGAEQRDLNLMSIWMQWADGAAFPLLQLIGCTNTEPGKLGFAFLGPFTVGIVCSTLRRTPHLKLKVLGYKLFVVFVMCVAQADGIRRTVVPACHIVLLLVLCSPAESEALCPDYQRCTLTTFNVQGPMSVLSAVHNTLALDMLVGEPVLPVVIVVKQPTERQLTARDVFSREPKVEGHVAFVDVHVQVLVIVRRILYHKRVVLVQDRTSPVLGAELLALQLVEPVLLGAEDASPEWQQHVLKDAAEHGLEADVV